MSVKGCLLGLILVTASLVGCLAAEDAALDAQGLDGVPGLVNDTVQRVVSVVAPDTGRGEPSLGVTSDGVLFTNPSAGTVYRSTDGGRNWTNIGEPTDPVPDFDPDLVVDADDNIWFDVLYLACNAVSVSQDGGDSWSPPNPAACPAPGGDRQYVIATEGCEAFIYYHQIPTFDQMASRTTDCGQTWVPTGPVDTAYGNPVTDGSGWGGGGFWNAVEDTVHMTFTWFKEDGWAPATALTRDDGASWEVVEVAQAKGDPLGLSLVVGAADAAGNVYISWGELLDDGEVAIYVAASTDDAASFSAPVRLDATDTSKVFPAITAGAQGRVAVAWYEADQPGHPNQVEDDTRWNVTMATLTDATSQAPRIERVQLSPDDVREGPICPNGSTCSEDREFLDYFALETLPDGRVATTYNSMLVDGSEGELRNVFVATEQALLATEAGDQEVAA